MGNSSRKSTKKFAAIFATAVFLTAVTASFAPQAVLAEAANQQEQNQTQSEIERLKQEQASIKSKIAALGDDISAQEEKQSEYENQIINVKAQLAIYQQELNNINQQIDEKIAAIEQAQAEIEEKSAEIEEKTTEYKKSDEKFRQRLTSMYMSNSKVNTLSVIFGSESFADFLTQSEMLKSISTNDQKLMDQLSSQKQELQTLKDDLETSKQTMEADKAVIETKKNELVTVQSQEQGKKDELDTLNAEVQAVIDKLSEQQGGLQEDAEMTASEIAQRESALQDLIQQEEARLAAEAEAERKRQEEAAAAQKPDSSSEADSNTSSDDTAGGGNSTDSSEPSTPSTPTPSIPNSNGWLWPCPGYSRISTPYGESGNGVHTTPHGGLDLAAPYGTSILASRGGYVVSAGFGVSGSGFGGYGNYVFIRDADGYYQLYAHCSSLNVSTGQTVTQGQTIARVGSTGQSTGNHLHFEVRNSSGSRLNPMSFISQP